MQCLLVQMRVVGGPTLKGEALPALVPPNVGTVSVADGGELLLRVDRMPEVDRTLRTRVCM